MAIQGSVTLTFGDGEHEFNVAKIKLVLELEEKCGTGIAEIFSRLRDNRWRLNDVRETLRLGLIGGGKTPIEALNLVQRYCDGRPYMESLQVAMVVLMAAMIGIPGDTVGKKAATEQNKAPGEAEPSLQPMAASSAPSFTGSAPPSDLTRES